MKTIGLKQKIICYFKGHDNPYPSYTPYWVFSYAHRTEELITGYVCRRCLCFQLESWWRAGDHDIFPASLKKEVE